MSTQPNPTSCPVNDFYSRFGLRKVDDSKRKVVPDKDKIISKIEVGELCYQSFPCQHRLKIHYKGGCCVGSSDCKLMSLGFITDDLIDLVSPKSMIEHVRRNRSRRLEN